MLNKEARLRRLNPYQTDLSCCILAAGQSSRFNYQDKAWQPFSSGFLIQSTLTAWQPQVQQMVVNPPRISPQYQQLLETHQAQPLIQHEFKHQGPLSGIYTALQWAKQQQQSWLIIAPLDMPKIPSDTALTLLKQQQCNQHSCFIARDNQHIYYCLGLWSVNLIPLIRRQLQQSQNRIRDLLKRIDWAEITISDTLLTHINSPRDLAN